MAEQLSLRRNNNVSYCDSRESWRPTRVLPFQRKFLENRKISVKFYKLLDNLVSRAVWKISWKRKKELSSFYNFIMTLIPEYAFIENIPPRRF